MLIFLSTLTTGFEKQDKICAIGLLAFGNDKIVAIDELVNEGKKISSKASSITHITNEMLKDKAKLQESKAYKFLQQNNNPSTTLISHNINYNLEKLKEIGFKFCGEIIDTSRVTKHLIQECEEFSLEFLKYELKLYKNEEKLKQKYDELLHVAFYTALGKSITLKLLYDCLLELSSKEDMATLSFENVLMSKLPFGKYSGKYIEEIAMSDRRYLEWMLNSVVDLDEDLRYSIEYYLKSDF